jgi:catechol 2,3-dioxygenase-like lactoylglutathione lyase family enzyme
LRYSDTHAPSEALTERAMAESRVVGVNHMGICVADMDRAVRLFRDVLGAAVTEPLEYHGGHLERATGVPGAASIICHATLGGQVFELLQYLSPGGRRTSDLRPCDAGHIHLALTVEGIDDMVDRFNAAGFVPAGPVERSVGSIGLDAIYTYGFDGLVIELIQYDRAGEPGGGR